MEGRELMIDYTNYRGEKSRRTIRVKNIRWGVSQWHTEPQWLMLATDLDKNEDREFAMKDMSAVTEKPA